MFDSLLQDIRYAARSLLRTPGFTIAAALTLAVGIGANAAIFSVFDAVLLGPLPYRDADRLTVVHEGTDTLIPANALHFREWRASTRSFENMALIGPTTYDLRGSGDATRINGARVTPSLFATLGVQPALGRVFTEEEDVPGRDNVVILSHEIWTTRFGAERGVVGRIVTIDDTPHEIVGVLPRGFALPKLSHLYALEVAVDRPEIWKPFAATPRDLRPLNSFSYIAIAKLKPGVTAAQAHDDINAVQRELARQAPEPAQFRATLVPLSDQIVSRSRTALQLLLGVVAMVLVIACVNITNLLLARSGRRQREFSIRRAAGADPGRLLRQLVVESLVLSTVAGVVGLILATAFVRGIQLTAPVDVPRIDEAALDWRSLIFTFVVAIGSGLAIGLVPAWRAARSNAAELLRASSVLAATAASGGRLRSLLVGIEMAVSAVCVAAAALLLASFANLLAVDRGFETERVVAVDLVLAPPRYERDNALRFLVLLTERTRALPGVTSVGVTDMLPLSGVSTSAVMVEGVSLPRPQRPGAMIRVADRGYFETMGITRRSGRLLDDRDRNTAVIAARTAERLWPGQDPLGKRFRHGPDDSPWVEVIGVVNDARAVTLTEEPPLLIYRPVDDYFYGLAALTVKTESDPVSAGASLQRLVREMDPQLVVPTPRTMDSIVEASMAQQRFQMNVMTLLAAVAMFLAAIGIYGVVSQGVIQRRSEFGLRMALGSQRRQIRTLVLRRAMIPVLLGLAAGVAASVGVGQMLRTLLFGVSPTAFVPLAAAGISLAAVALVAALIPAGRATRIEPLEALRSE
jgi:predicted permease